MVVWARIISTQDKCFQVAGANGDSKVSGASASSPTSTSCITITAITANDVTPNSDKKKKPRRGKKKKKPKDEAYPDPFSAAFSNLSIAATEFSPRPPNAEMPSAAPSKALPIDAYESEILSNVSSRRVTIIHGETGCGKSSRVPVMLLRSSPTARMFVSQPRRIAAKSLTDRVRIVNPDLRNEIGMRMGFGERDESRDTRLHFCTTGYLTRLLAFHPEAFDNHTHLVIDEVHERSVDTDILCLLAKRLLERNKNISLILMSATLAANIYKDYFGVDEDPIHVGVRTFPITTYFVEDILSNIRLSNSASNAAKDLQNAFNTSNPSSPGQIIQKVQRRQYAVAVAVAKEVGSPGSSVLIFVSGMNDIIEITELIESSAPSSTQREGITYVCMPIHSDIPFEEQMAAFEPAKEDEVKIVIATNAAESSVTLPDVDHVICLGLMKQIQYNKNTHRQMLTCTWISKASSKQRAGRTGRVREGNVYRLYSRDFFENAMIEFEVG